MAEGSSRVFGVLMAALDTPLIDLGVAMVRRYAGEADGEGA